MHDNMYREFDFLKQKYYEVLVPTILVQLSDKLGTVLDAIIVGFLIGSSLLPAINVVSPFILFTGIFYSLYGQGGSLLAIKYKSQFDYESSNKYFTLSVLGCVFSCLIYMLVLFIFADPLLHLLDTSADIFNASKIYLLIISGFFILNTYIQVLSYFLKSDGHAKLTLNAILIANSLNLILNFVFYEVLGHSISSIAFALVVGYLISAVYISKYFFDKTATFRLVSPKEFTFNDFRLFRRAALRSTPELVSRVFNTIKTAVIVYLCARFLGDVGLLAFLVYDNAETIVYLVVSGITKTVSPFITLFYNEYDFPSVDFITKKAIKEVLIFVSIISILFIIFPEILIKLFNITSLYDQKIVELAIRITSLGLIGRCTCLMLENYTQSISEFNISARLNLLHEFICPLIFLSIFVYSFGGVGIWIAITLSDIIPVLIYPVLVIRTKRKKKKEFSNTFLMLPPSESFYWTSIRGNFETIDDSMQDSNKDIIKHIESLFGKDYMTVTESLENIAKNIYKNDESINRIDIAVIITNKNQAILRFIYEGVEYNPFVNEKLLQSENIKNLSKFNHSFDYHRLFDMNFSFVIISAD